MPGFVLGAAATTEMLRQGSYPQGAHSPVQAYIQMAARKRRLDTVRDVFLEKVPLRWLWKEG